MALRSALRSAAMKRLLLISALLAFAWWRRNRFDEQDRIHGYGAYAPVAVD